MLTFKQDPLPIKNSSKRNSQDNLFTKETIYHDRNIFEQKRSKALALVDVETSSMIQKIKKRTEELKQVKRTISATTFSRLSQMKRIQNLKVNQIQSISPSRILIKQKSHYKTKITQNNKNHKVSPKPTLHQEQRYSDSYEDVQANSEFDKTQTAQRLPIGIKKQQQQLHENPPNIQVQKTKQNYQSNLKISNSSQIRTTSDKAKTQKKSNIFLNYRFAKRNTSSIDLRGRYEQKLKQSKQKILKNKVKMIQSQTNFKLEKKIRQNVELLEKQRLMKELVHRRMERQRQLTQINTKKNEQKRFVHENNDIKVKISRIFKKQLAKQQKQIQRSRSQESLLNLTYNRFLKQKQDVNEKAQLAYKFEFLKGLKSQDLMASHLINPENTCTISSVTQNSRITKKSLINSNKK